MLGTSGNYYKVSYNDRTGYVLKQYVDVSAATTPLPTVAVVETATGYPYETTTKDSVNLREKKSTSSGLIRQIPQGATITILAVSGDYAQVEYKEFASYPEIKAALDSGRIDAFCVDGSILAGYMDDTVMLLADRFSPQEYGVCIKKSNTDLAEYVDDLINGWLEDGTIDGLIEELGLVASFEG